MTKRVPRSLRGAVAAAAAALAILYATSTPAFGQCTKDTDCKGDRICVKGACVDPEPPAAQGNEAPAAPSEIEIKVCVGRLDNLSRIYGPVAHIDYGTPLRSQGGVTETDLGVPNGTFIYPVRLRFHDYRTGEAWIYRDSFGTLKCAKRGAVEYAPPRTPEERAAAIQDGETVQLPVKVFTGYAPDQHLTAGTVSVSRTSFSVDLPGTNQSFSASMENVFPRGVHNWQLQVAINVTDQLNRVHAESIFLWDPAVQQSARGSIDCSRCTDAMSALFSLLKVARAGFETPRTPEMDRLYGDNVARTRGTRAELEVKIDAGEEVTIPVRFNSGVGIINMVNASVTLSKQRFAYNPSCCGDHLIISPDKILKAELKSDPGQEVPRLRLKVVVTNKKNGKERVRDLDLYDPHATAPTDYAIVCEGCDDSLEILHALLARLRVGAVPTFR